MPDRYFVETPIAGLQARLEGSEAHHLAHVMRAKVGDEVTLFDGTGAEFAARVEKVGRSAVDLAVFDRHEVDRELKRHVTLAVSLPKGDRQRWLVEKATELGVARLFPLVTARGVAQPVTNAISRLRRAVLEASKQCGRNRLMEVAEPMAMSELIGAAPASASRWIAHPSAVSKPQPPAPPGGVSGKTAGTTDAPGQSPGLMGELPVAANAELFFAIGPEGGFTDDEVRAALDAGWQTLDLGPRILRVETAAIALAAWAALSAEG